MKINLPEPLPMWEAAAREMDTYRFAAPPQVQPRWTDIPDKIAITAAVAARQEGSEFSSIQHYVDAASSVIEAGACGVHIDFTWVKDEKGRRLDLDIPSVEAYPLVIEPLRKRFGNDFCVNLNVLNGPTFDACVAPAKAGLCEVAPCATGHPDAFMLNAFAALEQAGVKPEIVVHSSGEIELAKRKIIDTEIVKKPYNWLILYGLPFDVGRSILAGVWIRNTAEMARHLFIMVDQIRSIDPDAVISVCAAGRGSMYMTTLATMMGLHIRIGIEDTLWRFPHSDEHLRDNLQMMEMARDIALLHGRSPASANEYRQFLGLPTRD